MKTLSQTLNESLNESFYRLPKDVIKNDVHQVKGMFKSFVDKTEAGQDINVNQLLEIIKKLTTIADSAKMFSNHGEVEGTVYESIEN